ncbi:MAG: LuxR C-terminal-related transcriptional regulator [Chloroflexota bacterium]
MPSPQRPRPHRLLDADPLVGRAAELAVVQAAIQAHRLVTITGLGGVGKTRLAREIMFSGFPRRLRREVTFVDLAPIGDPAMVPAALAAALAVRESADLDVEAVILRHLDQWPSLLIADNLEHLPEAWAFVGLMLAGSPSLKVVATSRTALHLPDEHEIRLQSLTLPRSSDQLESSPAGELFLRRARSGGRLSLIDPADRAALVDICRRLDGLPLALELAASWTSLLSPRAILRRLEDRRLTLSDSSRGRQESIEQVVLATIGLLGPGERRVFDHLGLFAGPFDDGAAVAVCDLPSTLESLRALQAVSLVQVTQDGMGEPRFTLLETIRTVALSRLEPTDAFEGAVARYVDWYAARATEAADSLRARTYAESDSAGILGNPNVETAFERAAAAGNGEAAGQLAAALGTRDVSTGILRPAIARLVRARGLGQSTAATAADVVNALLSIRGNLRDFDGLVDLAHEALAWAHASGSQERIVRSLISIANWSRPEAEGRFREAIVLAEEIGYHSGAATAGQNLGLMLSDAGRTSEARDAYTGAIAAAERMDEPVALALALAARALTTADLGRAHEALADCRRGAAIMAGVEAALPTFRTWLACDLALAEVRAGNADAAMDNLLGVVDILAQLESDEETINWLQTAAIALARKHAVLATHCLGVLDVAVNGSSGEAVSATAALRSLATQLEQELGRVRFAAERRRGRDLSVPSMRTHVAATLRRERPSAEARVHGAFGTLTAREGEVLKLLAKGFTDPEIARELGIASKTASVHVANLKAKLGADSRVGAVLIAQGHAPGEGSDLVPG